MQDLGNNYDKKNLSEKENVTPDDLYTELYSDDYDFCIRFREALETDGFDLSKESSIYDE